MLKALSHRRLRSKLPEADFFRFLLRSEAGSAPALIVCRRTLITRAEHTHERAWLCSDLRLIRAQCLRGRCSLASCRAPPAGRAQSSFAAYSIGAARRRLCDLGRLSAGGVAVSAVVSGRHCRMVRAL